MTLTRWLPSFFAFPVGGLIAIETVGPLVGPASAARGGAVIGALLGAARWAGVTAAAVSGVPAVVMSRP